MVFSEKLSIVDREEENVPLLRQNGRLFKREEEGDESRTFPLSLSLTHTHTHNYLSRACSRQHARHARWHVLVMHARTCTRAQRQMESHAAVASGSERRKAA